MATPVEHSIVPRLTEISDQLIADFDSSGGLDSWDGNEGVYRFIRIAVNQGAEAGMDYFRDILVRNKICMFAK